MSALMLPKPPKTGPKPRTWLRKNKAWIRRSKPIRRGCISRRSGTPKRYIRVRRQARGPLAAAKRLCKSLCSKITLHEAGYVCACGCGQRATDAMHVLAVGAFENLRFVLLNILAGAHSCHKRLGSATLGDRSAMKLLFVRRRGHAAWEELCRMSQRLGPDVYETLDKLKAEAARLGIR